MNDNAETQLHDAIIYPRNWGMDKTTVGITRRTAISLDRNAKSANTQFTVQTQVRKEKFGRSEDSSNQTRVVTI